MKNIWSSSRVARSTLFPFGTALRGRAWKKSRAVFEEDDRRTRADAALRSSRPQDSGPASFHAISCHCLSRPPAGYFPLVSVGAAHIWNFLQKLMTGRSMFVYLPDQPVTAPVRTIRPIMHSITHSHCASGRRTTRLEPLSSPQTAAGAAGIVLMLALMAVVIVNDTSGPGCS